MQETDEFEGLRMMKPDEVVEVNDALINDFANYGMQLAGGDVASFMWMCSLALAMQTGGDVRIVPTVQDMLQKALEAVLSGEVPIGFVDPPQAN